MACERTGELARLGMARRDRRDMMTKTLQSFTGWLSNLFKFFNLINFEKPAPAPAWTRRTNCKICDRLIPLGRLKRYPRAVLCERPACTTAHRASKHNAAQRRWRHKRNLLDPEWKKEQNAKARLAHARRMRARKALVDTKVA